MLPGHPVVEVCHRCTDDNDPYHLCICGDPTAMEHRAGHRLQTIYHHLKNYICSSFLNFTV